MLLRRLAAGSATALLSVALMATPAFAKGGGGGGGGTTPPPPAASLCPEYAAGGSYLPDGSYTFAGEVPGVACLIVRLAPGGTLSLSELRVAAGWVADTRSSGGGSSNRVAVDLSDAATREKHSILIESGRTEIR
jgi:hypothetical protein